jgi:hypothetical protein
MARKKDEWDWLDSAQPTAPSSTESLKRIVTRPKKKTHTTANTDGVRRPPSQSARRR